MPCSSLLSAALSFCLHRRCGENFNLPQRDSPPGASVLVWLSLVKSVLYTVLH